MYQWRQNGTSREGLGAGLPAPKTALTEAPAIQPRGLIRFLRRLLQPALLLSVLSILLPAFGWTAATASPAPEPPAAVHGPRLLLVLPFENQSGDPTLGWIGEAVPQIFNHRLAAAGFLPISREDRLYALDHLGLPADFQPSRASTIRLAETLDAAYVIVGSFTTNQQRFTANVRVIDTTSLHMSPPIIEQSDIKDILPLFNGLAWRVAMQIDPQLPISRKTFIAADAHLPIGVFEDYVRGLIAPDPDDGIRRLKEAVRLDPKYTPALMALGMAYFDNQQYKPAATTLGRLPTDAPHAREADFYRGLAFLYVGSNTKAEDAFAFVAQQLPLPAALNNEGVASSRRGKDASGLFQRAAEADPTDADYPFNLAISLAARKDFQGALQAVHQSLRLQPEDSEALDFEKALEAAAQAPPPAAATASSAAESTTPAKVPAAGSAAAGKQSASDSIKLPKERVKRTLNEAAFQQLAAEMESMEAANVAELPPAQRAATLAQQGTLYLDKGLVLQAEREFQAAIHADNSNADAHAGLAEVREKTGDAAGARTEAQASLKLKPNVTAYLVLARLDMAVKQMASASGNVNRALHMQPENSAALNLKRQIEAGTQTPAKQ